MSIITEGPITEAELIAESRLAAQEASTEHLQFALDAALHWLDPEQVRELVDCKLAGRPYSQVVA